MTPPSAAPVVSPVASLLKTNVQKVPAMSLVIQKLKANAAKKLAESLEKAKKQRESA